MVIALALIVIDPTRNNEAGQKLIEAMKIFSFGSEKQTTKNTTNCGTGSRSWALPWSAPKLSERVISSLQARIACTTKEMT